MNPFEDYRITSSYGYRSDPFTGKRDFHTGIDLVKPDGIICAFVPGIVVHAKMGIRWSGFGGFGNVVAIKDKYGALHCYCHLASVSVAKGDKVEQGQEVGLQGSTGRSTGPHLHYEVRTKSFPSYGYGSHTGPTTYLREYFEKDIPLIQRRNTVLVEDTGKMYDTFLINNKTYIELRDCAEALGRQVGFDNATKQASIKKSGG